jgi:GT2 family glycosyltransferase/glycosyltransferase involved in cell wall biosynthesis
VLNSDQIGAFGLILDRLELAAPPEEMLAQIRKRMTLADFINLLALLDFVIHSQGAAHKDVQGATVIEAADLESGGDQFVPRRNILFVTGQFPNPMHGGGSRLMDFIKIMSRHHNIYLYTWFDEDEDSAAYQELGAYCKGIEAVPCQDFEGSLDNVKAFVANVAIDIVHYEWPRSLTNYDPALGKYHIFTYMEAVSLRLLRDLPQQARLSSNWLRKMIELLNALKVEVVDSERMDSHVVVTRQDAEFLSRFTPGRSYTVVSHGINMDEFALADTEPEDDTLVFVGNYLHYPNEDAVRFFFEKVHALVKDQVPDLKVYLVGADPTPPVKAHHDGRHVFVTGGVADIRPYIQRASVCIAPLITGAGYRGKVIQYAALRRACVATSIAATGMLLEDGKEIFIADDPALFAERVVYLLKHPAAARMMAQSAYEKVRLHYDNQRFVQCLYRTYADLEKTGPRFNRDHLSGYSRPMVTPGRIGEARFAPKRLAQRLLPLHWQRILSDKLRVCRGLTRAGRPRTSPGVLSGQSRLDAFVFSEMHYGRTMIDEQAHESMAAGSRWFFISPIGVKELEGDAPLALSRNGYIFDVQIPGLDQVVAPSSNPMDQSALDNAMVKIQSLIHEQAVEEAVCIVQHPMWEPVVQALRERYGWKVVIDSATFDKGADEGDRGLAEARERVLAASDLAIASAHAPGCWGTQEGCWNEVKQLYGQASIIIVSYNGLELIRRCVRSILERTIYPNYRIIIVDNNSTDDVKAYLLELQRHETRVQVVLNEANKGFPAANNIGLQRAHDSEFVVLLNNDTIVPRGWLCRLLRHARHPQVGMVGPVTNWTGNEAKIDVSYGDVKDMEAFARAYTYAHEGQAFDIKMLAMYCVAMRKAVTDQIGPLDERFGMGMFEDEDYARRVRQAGYRVVCAQDVFVHHYGMASFARLAKSEYRDLFERNKQLYEEKWGEPWQPHKSRTHA